MTGVTHGDVETALAAARTEAGISAFDAPKAGLRALVSSAVANHERLPMLEVVYDRFVRALSTALRLWTGDTIEVTIERLSAMRFSDYMDDAPAPSLIGVFAAEEWKGLGLITIDSPLVYSLVDVLMGGRRAGPHQKSDARAFTTIETDLMREYLAILMRELRDAFAPITNVHFGVDRLETNPRFTNIARDNNIVSVASVRIAMEERGGLFSIMIPYGTFEPVREQLLQRFMGEKLGRDNIWETHLANETLKTNVPIDAVLATTMVPLGEVRRLKVGQVLPLPVGHNEPIELKCGDVTVAKGMFGKSARNLVVRLTETVRSKGKR